MEEFFAPPLEKLDVVLAASAANVRDCFSLAAAQNSPMRVVTERTLVEVVRVR